MAPMGGAQDTAHPLGIEEKSPCFGVIVGIARGIDTWYTAYGNATRYMPYSRSTHSISGTVGS